MDQKQKYYEVIKSSFVDQRINITYDLGQDIIHSQVPPLRNLILIKIISDLWQYPEVRKEVSTFGISYPHFINKFCKEIFWDSVEERVKSQLHRLHLTKDCADLGYRICHAIGCHIYEYITDDHFEKIPKNLYAENYAITYQGTINKMKTVLLILQKLTDPCLKYEFVCYYFIENQVRNHFNSLPPHLKVYYLYELDCSLPNFYLAFWGWRLSADKTLFYNITRLYRFGYISYAPTFKRDCLMALFEYQILCNNVVAVQYLWKTMLDEEEKKNILLPCAANIIHSGKHRNMMCYFISQMNTDQQRKLLINNEYRILIRLLDWRWEKVFLQAAKFTFRFITIWNFAEILHELVYYFCSQYKCFSKDPSCRRVLLKFLYFSPSQAREFVIREYPHKYYDMMVNLFQTNDGEIIDLFTTFPHPRDLMYSSESIDLCVQFIEENEFETIDLYIKSILKHENQILDFKRDFIGDKGQELCIKFLILEKWEAVNNFMKWCPFNEEQAKEFKGSLPFVFEGEIINVFICNLNFDFKGKTKTIDRILNWCFENNTSLIRACKKKVLLNIPYFYTGSSFNYKCMFYIEAKKLIVRRKWEIVEKCFAWCFADEEDIKSFCNILLSDEAYIQKIIKYNLNLKLLNYVLDSCNADSIARHNIKSSILNNDKFLVKLIAKVKIDEVFYIVNWCIPLSEGKDTFEKSLLNFNLKEESLKRLLKMYENFENLKKSGFKLQPVSKI